MKNPIIKERAGDPFILRDGDDYYLTATLETANERGDHFACWHSKDLEHWSDPVTILDFKDVSWAHSKAWAPSMVEKDGYYYFAFCADQQIGVAVCATPMGAYRDLLGRPLVAKEDYDFQTIDPAFFKDGDGKIYLAFGQGRCMISELELTPTSARFLGETVCLSDMLYSQSSVNYPPEVKSIYNEAPDLIKIGDRYLLSWAVYDVADYRYGVRYAWGARPMGPYVMPLDFDHDNMLLQGRHDITGCGHACVVEYRGEYYIVYGRHCRDRVRSRGREMCCEKIVFVDGDHLAAVPSR